MVTAKPKRTTRSGRVLSIMAQKMPGFGQVHRMSGLLDEAAALIPDFAVYQTLCAQSLREAWESDRNTGKREAHNRRRAWLRLFRRFARLQDIRKDLRIAAVDRSGTYGCELTAKPDRGLAWKEFVLRARLFGIYEGEIEALVEKAEKRKRSKARRSGA